MDTGNAFDNDFEEDFRTGIGIGLCLIIGYRKVRVAAPYLVVLHAQVKGRKAVGRIVVTDVQGGRYNRLGQWVDHQLETAGANAAVGVLGTHKNVLGVGGVGIGARYRVRTGFRVRLRLVVGNCKPDLAVGHLAVHSGKVEQLDTVARGIVVAQ